MIFKILNLYNLKNNYNMIMMNCVFKNIIIYVIIINNIKCYINI